MIRSSRFLIYQTSAGTEVLSESELNIVFNDVHFSYDEDRDILKGIDMTLPQGTFISLVGESGCGKSTIAGILAGKNKSYRGDIQSVTFISIISMKKI